VSFVDSERSESHVLRILSTPDFPLDFLANASLMPWQLPNATEAYAAQAITLKEGYLPFPWATWIDRVQRGLPGVAPSPIRDHVRRSDLIRATVCQHIRALDHIEFFLAAGVTDLFWSHATNEFQQVSRLRIHPFPLYPVRCSTHPPPSKFLPSSQRPLLYSFQGAYAHGLYLTPVRDWILKLPPRQDAQLERRQEWHYEQSVYREQLLGQGIDQIRSAHLSAEADAYVHTLKNTCFALCPSGSGPNSIRLWEALGYGAIPVILSDKLLLPGDQKLWQKAVVLAAETEGDVAALPTRLEALAADFHIINAMQLTGQKLWQRYGLPGFVPDVLQFLHDPIAVLRSRALQDLPADPVSVVAYTPAQLPLQLRRSLLGEPPERPVLIQIEDHAPAELAQLRWGPALRTCRHLLSTRTFRVVSLAPLLV
jgi:hypothetical protein